MGLYEGIKDVAKVVQQADNVDLYLKLLDLCAQALDLQEEVNRLREENRNLKKKRDISERVLRHIEPVVTLADDSEELYYCSHCWDSEQMLIQANCKSNGTFICPHCGASGNYSNEKKQQYKREEAEKIAQISTSW